MKEELESIHLLLHPSKTKKINNVSVAIKKLSAWVKKQKGIDWKEEQQVFQWYGNPEVTDIWIQIITRLGELQKKPRCATVLKELKDTSPELAYVITMLQSNFANQSRLNTQNVYSNKQDLIETFCQLILDDSPYQKKVKLMDGLLRALSPNQILSLMEMNWLARITVAFIALFVSESKMQRVMSDICWTLKLCKAHLEQTTHLEFFDTSLKVGMHELIELEGGSPHSAILLSMKISMRYPKHFIFFQWTFFLLEQGACLPNNVPEIGEWAFCAMELDKKRAKMPLLSKKQRLALVQCFIKQGQSSKLFFHEQTIVRPLLLHLVLAGDWNILKDELCKKKLSEICVETRSGLLVGEDGQTPLCPNLFSEKNREVFIEQIVRFYPDVLLTRYCGVSILTCAILFGVDDRYYKLLESLFKEFHPKKDKRAFLLTPLDGRMYPPFQLLIHSMMPLGKDQVSPCKNIMDKLGPRSPLHINWTQFVRCFSDVLTLPVDHEHIQGPISTFLKLKEAYHHKLSAIDFPDSVVSTEETQIIFKHLDRQSIAWYLTFLKEKNLLKIESSYHLFDKDVRLLGPVIKQLNQDMLTLSIALFVNNDCVKNIFYSIEYTEQHQAALEHIVEGCTRISSMRRSLNEKACEALMSVFFPEEEFFSEILEKINQEEGRYGFWNQEGRKPKTCEEKFKPTFKFCGLMSKFEYKEEAPAPIKTLK